MFNYATCRSQLLTPQLRYSSQQLLAMSRMTWFKLCPPSRPSAISHADRHIQRPPSLACRPRSRSSITTVKSSEKPSALKAFRSPINTHLSITSTVFGSSAPPTDYVPLSRNRSITESKHITAVKNPWRHSSKRKALEQILKTNVRMSKIAVFRSERPQVMACSVPMRSRPLNAMSDSTRTCPTTIWKNMLTTRQCFTRMAGVPSTSQTLMTKQMCRIHFKWPRSLVSHGCGLRIMDVHLNVLIYYFRSPYTDHQYPCEGV